MICVDLETTGLLVSDTKDPEHQPGIVQIGLVKVGPDYEPAKHFSWLVNPEKRIEDDAVKVHGITNEQVYGKPTLTAIFPDLCEAFLGEDTWIGFNNEFDRRALYFALARYGLEARFPWPSKDLDVMKIAKPIINMAGKRDIKPPTLTELHMSLFGNAFHGAHDALADCLATVACLGKLVEDGYL